MRHITLIAFLLEVKYTIKNSSLDPSGQLTLCTPGVFGFLSQVARSLRLLRCLAVIDVLISTNQSVQVLSNEISNSIPHCQWCARNKFPLRPPWASAKGAQGLGAVQMSTLIRRVVMHSRARFITSWWGGVVKALTWSLVCFAWSLDILITPSYVSACDLWGLPLWDHFRAGFNIAEQVTSFVFLIKQSSYL